MAHIVVEAAEAILDDTFVVHKKGFIRLVDYMGGDARIVQAARVSYGKGTKSLRDDEKLIHYLLKHGHTSPFEQVMLTFHCKMPLFVARQWMRHRTARVNEVSGRYSLMPEEFYLPDSTDIAKQSSNNKQGRGDTLEASAAAAVQQLFAHEQSLAYQAYQDKVETHQLARELARINLPLSLYTEIYWQIDLHNLFHFLQLRLHPHAQKEIRDYAEVMMHIVQQVAPIACAAFREYQLESLTLSAHERDLLRGLIHASNVSHTIKDKF
jgi:thymidylate synthase (FAD)